MIAHAERFAFVWNSKYHLLIWFHVIQENLTNLFLKNLFLSFCSFITDLHVIKDRHNELRKFRNFEDSNFPSSHFEINKTLYGALTRWGYTNTRITVHDHT